MSVNNSQYDRKAAKRVLPNEFNQAEEMFQEGDGERDPKFLLLPSGDAANRVAIIGTLTDIEDVGSDSPYYQARMVSPTGEPFFAYAGQYQSDAMNTIANELSVPSYVLVVGKPRVYEGDDGETRVSITPETIKEVGEDLRDQWVADAAEATLDRIEAFDPSSDDIDAMAAEHHGRDHSDLVETVIETLEGETGDAPSEDAGASSEEAVGDGMGDLANKSYNELKAIAGSIDGVTAKGDKDTLIDRIEGAM